MKYIIYFFSLTAFMYSCQVNPQQFVELTDNLEIPSNSNIKIIGGEYTFGDDTMDGVIQIVDKNNIMLDGDSVTVHGLDFSGYMINVENSHHVTIKNFDWVDNYKYAIRVLNSHDITINGNTLSFNKKDTIGWIEIWTGVNNALGGGVLMHQCRKCELFDNTMQQQNDGIALYECDSIQVHHNILNWNTGFGVRMNFTDSCYINNNDCSHINRLTDPSDCAAILLIVSNNNIVEYNDLTYSGDGVFLGQYNHSQIPNNNYFAYNDCSYSPHNAIEATFADGNVYKHNLCNYSHYGFWLGYSFNSLVDSNEVIGNQHSGIAIDRGYNNTIINNTISENPTGIELWEGDPIPPYQDQESRDYFIKNNIIEGNSVAVSAIKTEHLVVQNNDFIKNRNGVYFEGSSSEDTITDNLFDHTTIFHLENISYDDIYAINNDFMTNDEALISCKIFDAEDVFVYGEVIWHPYVPGPDPVWQTTPPTDLAEPPAIWYQYPEACWGYGLWEPTTIRYDHINKVVGDASVHISTGNGWDIGASYRPGSDSLASWHLTEMDSIGVWYKSVNNTGYGFQYHWIILGNNCGGFYKYTASAGSVLNPTIGQWVNYRIPVAGNSQWSRSSQGNISLDEINYIEIHVDTWEYGFEFWIDGLSFTSYYTSIDENDPDSRQISIQNQPNPFSGYTIINYSIPEKGFVTLQIKDVAGNVVMDLVNKVLQAGNHQYELQAANLLPGVYFFSLEFGGQQIEAKGVKVR
ncbi:MAG: right-handed parallel beta-helix repeat-containing protein [Bacteroidales bacterium]|nr:right-handed parallel beta-helix repeat-containing protein [Bacteroidales bacterium]